VMVAVMWPGSTRVREGFALIEVIVAIALLGVMVVSLVEGLQTACDAASRLREQAAVVSERSEALSNAAAWNWGAAVEHAEWSAGPRLTLQAGGGLAAGGQVGVWADGWPLGEWSVRPGVDLVLEPSVWGGLTGSELVLRAREEGGSWGPPYRTVVPDEYGGLASAPVEPLAADLALVGFHDIDTVVHVRALGTTPSTAEWTAEPFIGSADDLVKVLVRTTAGSCSLRSGGRVQTWIASACRGLDVYW
jgi:prepilin-type N-terminal cleavage/methylation domain-containing protein